MIRIHFTNEGSKPHSLHFHGIHKAEMDGVFESIGTGGKFTYEFYAEPVGLHLYHCHVHPVEEHIAHGLYGAYIVDPKEGRDSADEFVFVLNGLDTDFDGVLAPLAGTIGTIQASEVVKEILGIGSTLCGFILIVDALKLTFRKVKLNKRTGCICYEKKK